jgi:alkylation response protein AidB-like acyl-CoA dehydrogenase
MRFNAISLPSGCSAYRADGPGMNFIFSEEQQMAGEMSRRLFADTCAPAQLRELLKLGAPRDPARWKAIVGAGLTAVLLPTKAGGIGLGEVDFIQIAEAAGYAALPEPLVESAGIAAPMLAAIEPRHTLLTDPLNTLAIGHPVNPFVADADTAAALLLFRDGETFLIDPNTARLIREESIDPFRRLFRVEWTPSLQISTDASLWEDAFDRGALFAAAQCIGLARRTLDLAVDYAKVRTQFGKQIGSYQAIKHLLATVQVKIEFARPIVHAAAAQFAGRDSHSRARISHAKLASVEAADLSARTAIQVHGAMGFSWEVDVHFFLKRALALTYAWGKPDFHRRRVEAYVFERPPGSNRTTFYGQM